jgi:hypothetical protein
MEKFSHFISCGIDFSSAHFPFERESSSPFKRVDWKGAVKKCPPVNRISSIFSSALQTVSQLTHHKSATGMPLQSKIALRTMNICLYQQDPDCPRQGTKVPLKRGANLSGNEGGHLFSARVHKVKNQDEETHDSIERKHSASCWRPHPQSSMAGSSVQKDE